MSESKRSIEELKLAGLFGKDSDYGGGIGEAVKELLKVFAKQRHSGFSAGLTATVFHKLVRGETLTPLTGKKEEWIDTGSGLWQNKRCGRVFSRDKGKTGEDIERRVFSPKKGGSFTCSESKEKISFPYMPITEIIQEGTKEAKKWQRVFKK